MSSFTAFSVGILKSVSHSNAPLSGVSSGQDARWHGFLT
jgi:hypothetical protein